MQVVFLDEKTIFVILKMLALKNMPSNFTTIPVEGLGLFSLRFPLFFEVDFKVEIYQAQPMFSSCYLNTCCTIEPSLQNLLGLFLEY